MKAMRFFLALAFLALAPAAVHAGDIYAYLLCEGGRTSAHFAKFFTDGVYVGLLLGYQAFLEAVRKLPEEKITSLDDLEDPDAIYWIDADSKRVMFFAAGICSLAERRVFLAMAAKAWPRWTVEWADAGPKSIAVASGLALTEDHFNFKRPTSLSRYLNGKLPCETVVTVLSDGPVARDYPVSSIEEVGSLLHYGPKMLEDLAGTKAAERPLREEDIIEGGLVLDPKQRRMWYWQVQPLRGIDALTTTDWPGWTSQVLPDGLLGHMRVSGRTVAPSPAADAAAARVLARAMAHWEKDPGETGFQTALHKQVTGEGGIALFTPQGSAPGTSSIWVEIRQNLESKARDAPPETR